LRAEQSLVLNIEIASSLRTVEYMGLADSAGQDTS